MIVNATERGVKKGTKNEQIRLIISMSKEKLSPKTISKVTGLSIEKVEKILNLNK